VPRSHEAWSAPAASADSFEVDLKEAQLAS